MTTELKPEHQDVWRGTYNDWPYKVVLHGKGKAHCAGGQGTWCYYIYIHESRIGKEAFEHLWLKPQKLEHFSFVSYDYYKTPVAALDWHGDVTYYEKYGEVEGKRCVEFGCDYNHLYDDQTHWTLELVLLELQETLNQLIALYPNATNPS